MPKILIIRFSSIGDIVLTSPVMRCVKQQVPGAEIHFLSKEAFLSLLQPNPYIDRIYTIRKNLKEVIPTLQKEKYDYIIDLHHNLRSSLVKTQLGVEAFSFKKLNVKKFLLVKFKINRLPPVHIVDRYLETVANLGVKNDGKGLDFFIAPEQEVELSQLPVSHQKGYTAFVIGAKQATKQLPLEKMIALCKLLKVPVLLLGGKEDRERGELLVKACGNNILNTCGQYTLQQSASLLKQATWVISHDTGLMHISAAFKKNILSIWGNTVAEFGMTPYQPGPQSEMFEVKNLDCRPCSKIGYAQCPKKHFNCMNLQAVEAIAERIC